MDVLGWGSECDQFSLPSPSLSRRLQDQRWGGRGLCMPVGRRSGGFLLLSLVPPDVDECRRSPRPCANGHCENTRGSYSCRCRSGYQVGPSGTECHGESCGGLAGGGNDALAWGLGPSFLDLSRCPTPQTLMSVPEAPCSVPMGSATIPWAPSAAPVLPATAQTRLAWNAEVRGRELSRG